LRIRVIETSIFTRKVTALLTDEEYRNLQNELVINPEKGKIIKGSNGFKIASRGRIAMKKELFDELQESIKQGGSILRGKRKPAREFDFENPNPRQIREKLGLSQNKFAGLLGISTSTLQNWEQGRRKPEGPAKILLNVAARYPDAVLDTVFISSLK